MTRRALFASLLAPVALKRQNNTAPKRLRPQWGKYTLEEIRAKEDAITVMVDARRVAQAVAEQLARGMEVL